MSEIESTRASSARRLKESRQLLDESSRRLGADGCQGLDYSQEGWRGRSLEFVRQGRLYAECWRDFAQALRAPAPRPATADSDATRDLSIEELRADNARLVQEVAHLRAALLTRDVIGMAKGLLIGREGCSEDQALDMLRRASQRLNIRLAVVAERMLAKYRATSDGPHNVNDS